MTTLIPAGAGDLDIIRGPAGMGAGARPAARQIESLAVSVPANRPAAGGR